MATLDLYKERAFNTVRLTDREGAAHELKIPLDYTVEEVERILEKQEQIKSLAAEEVIGDGREQSRRFWELVFAELEILFQHYQPGITADTLRSLITHDEALKIIDFHRPAEGSAPEGKKKVRRSRSMSFVA